MILVSRKLLSFKLNYYFRKVKFISFFLGLVVLALGCMPCADDGLTNNSVEVKYESARSHSHQGDGHADACSPFCHCTCCAGFSINHALSTDINPEITSGNLFTSYLPSDLSQISLSIWQPPQLS